eukprot:6210320-Pleurochrysis_carterae.AAC.1
MLSLRALLICSLTLTCTVSQVAFASHAYWRRARAPRSEFLSPRFSHDRPSLNAPDPKPPSRRAPAPAPALAPDPGWFVFNINCRFPPGPDGSSGRSYVENQKVIEHASSGMRAF